jgi:hypothetical protein
MDDTTMRRTERRRRAATWICDRYAVIAMTTPDGPISSDRIDGGRDRSAFLADVVRHVGTRDELFIAGTDALRTELERRYVAVHHRPEAIVDVERLGEAAAAALSDRLCPVA